MRITTSWDDGSIQDMQIAELLHKYELPATFYVSNATNQLAEEDLQELALEFELGGHTWSHPMDIKKLSKDDAYNDIRANKEWLEDIAQTEVTKFCYPRGRYNDGTIDVLKDLDFEYARTTLVGYTTEATDPFRTHTTVHVHPSRKEYINVNWLDYAIQQYNLSKKQQNGYYHIWGHGWEIEELNLWDDLEKLFAYIYGDKDNRSNNNSN